MAAKADSKPESLCLVIGGGGFLGRHIVDKLLEEKYKVQVFDIRITFDDERVKFFVGDLCKEEWGKDSYGVIMFQDLLPALRDVDIVFHVATPPPLSNDQMLFHKVNCEGTQTVLEACRNSGVKRLVLTSSASVLYEGKDIKNATEDTPYASKPMDTYTETKISQEKLVLAANSPELMTVAIRPHGIFGPRDPHMVPTTARLSAAGKTKFIIGKGKNLVDFTYVENVVHGHLLAAQCLKEESPVCGKAYHITNDAPLPFWDFMTSIITGLGYPAPKIKLPFWLIYGLAMVLHWICVALRPIKKIQPTFTPMTVALAGTHHYYSCQRAKDELGYVPPVSMEDGIKNTLEYFKHLKKGASSSSNGTPDKKKE